jgi:hypothetical protein
VGCSLLIFLSYYVPNHLDSSLYCVVSPITNAHKHGRFADSWEVNAMISSIIKQNLKISVPGFAPLSIFRNSK